MKLSIQILTSIIIFSSACTLYAKNPPNKMLAVIEENAGHVEFYNPSTGKNLGGLQVGFLPHEVAIAKDGKTAYVTNFGIRDYDSGSGIPGASISIIDIPHRVERNRLYTFDVSTNKDYQQIDSAPHGIKLRPPFENELYVNVEKGNKVLVYDIKTNALSKKFDVSLYTHNLVFSKDGKILWLMAGKDGVIRMDPDSGKITGSVVLSSPVRGLKYTPDNRYLMASAVNQVVFIDPVTLKIVKEFNNLGVGPILYSDITPDQKYIIAPAAFDNQIVIIEVATGNVVKRIVTGLNPVTVLVGPSGKYVYNSNATDKHLTKTDLTTLTSTKIMTHDGPNSMTFVPYYPNSKHKKLTLGVALPLTGSDSVRGRDMMRGYEYWRLKLEQAGGLLIKDDVYDINIVYLDTQSDNSKIPQLTKDLINNHHVTILLSTYGVTGYNLEHQIAMENNIIITPAQSNESPWTPNDNVTGQDYFVTTKAYNEQFLAQYNFKASNYTACATALGLVLQKSLLTANSFDYDGVTKILSEAKFNVFYRY